MGEQQRQQQRHHSLGSARRKKRRTRRRIHAVAAVASLIVLILVSLWFLGILNFFSSEDGGDGADRRGAERWGSLRRRPGERLHAADQPSQRVAPRSPRGDSTSQAIEPEPAAAKIPPRRPEDPPAAPPVLLSRSPTVVVAADVRGNLGSPSVLNQDPPSPDWIKDRWQAASDMGGTAIKGAHWVLVDFGVDAVVRAVSKVVLDWEAAFAEDYRVEVSAGRGRVGGGGQSIGGGEVERKWTVLYDGSDPDQRRSLRSVEESGQSPGVKAPTPLHVVHTLGPFPSADAVVEGTSGLRYLRVWIRKPAAGWGVSLWQVDVYGHHA